MALADGRPGEMSATLRVLRPGTRPLLERHLSIGELVKSGAARALGVTPAQLDGEQEALLPFVQCIHAAMAEASA
jgi:hypothetical protein